jgi:hypothetical protein
MRPLVCLVCSVCVLGGCVSPPRTEPPAGPSVPQIKWIGYGHRQLSPEGWTFVEVRQALTNTTSKTIWVSKSLWRRPAYEPAPQPTLATEPKSYPMRTLDPGEGVTFHEWALKGRPYQARVWYKTARDGSPISLRGPKLKP